MTVSAIGALNPHSKTSATHSTSSTALTQHKHGAHSLKGNFAIAASDALSNMGASAAANASNHFSTILNNLKLG
jgi:hypothetical protein